MNSKKRKYSRDTRPIHFPATVQAMEDFVADRPVKLIKAPGRVIITSKTDLEKFWSIPNLTLNKLVSKYPQGFMIALDETIDTLSEQN